MLLPDGQVNFLMHHSGSVITQMSQKALGEFDFDLMKSVIDNLKIINSELNRLHGKLPKLKKAKSSTPKLPKLKKVDKQIMETK